MGEQVQTAALSLYILTFNCGRAFIDVDAFASQLFSAMDSPALPDLVVLSLQELAPLSHAFIGGSFIAPYFERFSHAVQKAAAKWVNSNFSIYARIYTPITIQNRGMTGLMVFAKDAAAIQDIETSGIGFGVLEMGNKGAVGARFTYDVEGSSTELTFVGAHLEAMEDAVKHRNENWKSIVRGLVFSSTNPESKQNTNILSGEDRPLLSISAHDATIYKSTSHLFVAGDLNYRTSILSPSPDDYENSFPQPYHDESSPNHFLELFKSDQLNQERHEGRTLHGLIESKVAFPPTYKYDPVGPFLTRDEELSRWNWARHRWPSWCDRILYLEFPSWMKGSNAQITPRSYSALPLFPTSDHRAVAMEFKVPLVPIIAPEGEEGDDPRIHPPFEIDIDWKQKRDRARMLEIIVGYGAYFTTTYEGGAVALAMAAGLIGAFFAIQAMI